MMLQRIFNHFRLRFISLSSQTLPRKVTVEKQVELALEWFENSILKSGGGAAKYSMLFHSYLPAYPETNGYWLNTLLLVRQHFPEVFKSVFEEREIIREIADWLISIQRLDGTFPGSYGDFMNQPPRVFNNGQIILGLLNYYKNYHQQEALDSAIKSADWLLKVQSDDGSWRQFTLHQLSSNTRTAWALILLGQFLKENKYIEAGTRNIEFALTLQKDNGYFKDNGFDSFSIPSTHTIGYAIRGITGAAIATGNRNWLKSSQEAFDPVITLMKENGFMPGDIDEFYSASENYTCLTGNCQLSTVGYLLYNETGNEKYKEAADQLINYVKRKQLVSDDPHVTGGISGSWPISGKYCSYDIPNWAVKFFVDALIYQKIYSQNSKE